MKVHTDPKTAESHAVLASADNTAICRTIDVLMNAAQCDGEDAAECKVQAEWLKIFVKEHQQKAKAKSEGTPLLNKVEKKVE